MNKINILLLTLLLAPIFTFLLFSHDAKSNLIYLHEQQKTTRSSQDHLNSFANTGNVVIDFYADWCPPCRRLSPLLDAVAAMMPHITFVKINRDFFKDLANTYNVTSIPTLIFLRNGKEIGRYNGGPLNQQQLAQLVTNVYHVA